MQGYTILMVAVREAHTDAKWKSDIASDLQVIQVAPLPWGGNSWELIVNNTLYEPPLPPPAPAGRH
jgi:hypothetical protein